MFVASFVTGPWQANCYLLAADGSDDVVIVDPGMDAAPTVFAAVAEHGLKPVAVLATHGHLDHVADAVKVCAEYGIPCWIHSADRHLLADPIAGLGSDSAELVHQLYPDGFTQPDEVRLYDGLDTLSVAGMEFTLVHAPGHTQGCVLLMLAYPGGKPVSHLVLSGDVLFAGSIGRTDLPGGDIQQMRQTLAGPVLALPDSAGILPGHGQQTSMAAERANNPYLSQAFLGRPAAAAGER
ncbi:MAG: MBL fold metallo-hydrolase [Propionibacteriaceae bacterium]|nr:MBL fold metallo-hydrolase [Propionibacteriaceae bacterium]